MTKYSFFVLILFSTTFSFAQKTKQPNIILIMTDDQGYGDLGYHNNPLISTPVIDKFAGESISFENFYVSPVCAPTRSSLMTGRYSIRTGVRDTYNGGATMASSEYTIAEMLHDAGYQTGIFGKWHLGDNFPHRPMDQGFDTSVTHLGGGMGQVGDFTTYFRRDSSYFDPILWENGERKQYDGYCTDIFTDEAIKFIKGNSDTPFFCYIAYNAPHTPLQVPREYYEKYKDIDPVSKFSHNEMPFPEMTEKDKEDARKVYAMVENIDDNLKRVFNTLDNLNITENTIVIFMTDNGPQQNRYRAGMRGTKGTVYRGGVRVPFYLRYPHRFPLPLKIETTAAHIDIMSTLADLCNITLPGQLELDGLSLVPLLENKSDSKAFNNRPLFFYWARKYPALYHNIALQKGDYKLVGNTDFDAKPENFELFNVRKDPFELTNLASTEGQQAEKLKAELDSLYTELIKSKNLNQDHFSIIGHPKANPVILNRNDAGGQRGIWAQEDIHGSWKVDIKPGKYRIHIKFIQPVQGGGKMFIEFGHKVLIKSVENGEISDFIIPSIELDEFQGELIPFYSSKGRNIFPFWMQFEKINP